MPGAITFPIRAIYAPPTMGDGTAGIGCPRPAGLFGRGESVNDMVQSRQVYVEGGGGLALDIPSSLSSVGYTCPVAYLFSCIHHGLNSSERT